MALGEKIKSARKMKGFTQQQLAEIVNVKHNTISDWENEKSNPDPDMLELLCGVLEITPTFLLGSKSDDEYAVIIAKMMKETGMLDMMDDYISLSDEDKKAIRQIISSLKKSRG